MFNIHNNRVVCLIFFTLALCVYSQGLNIHGLEYRDDEVFYVKSTQQMMKTGDVLSPKYFEENRFQKPILYYWLILLSYKIFGVNWFAARFVAVVFAGLTVSLTWLMANQLFNRRTAHVSALILMTIPMFFRHAKNAVPDMPLTFFIVLALYFMLQFIQSSSQRERYSILFFIACGFGFMIKGFAAWIVPIGTFFVYALMTKNYRLLLEIRFFRGLGIMFLIVAPWFLYMIKTHGIAYFEYMLVNETADRLIGKEGGSFFLMKGKMFLAHALFYLKTIFSLFLPWSIFFIGALPLALKGLTVKATEATSLRFLLIWTLVVFFFFSIMYFKISHYMMPLMTPLAILTSYFLLYIFEKPLVIVKAAHFYRTFFILVSFLISYFAYLFLTIFLVGINPWWLTIFGVGLILFVMIFVKSRDLSIRPILLAVFILFVLAQPQLFDSAGLTTHSTLQKFAQILKDDKIKDVVIGVGSHDIHEKEFQVYFNERVIKAGASTTDETIYHLKHLFQTNSRVYCLITKRDYDLFFKSLNIGHYHIIAKDEMVRKRMNLDLGFFKAVIQVDQVRVKNYFMEEILLIRRNEQS